MHGFVLLSQVLDGAGERGGRIAWVVVAGAVADGGSVVAGVDGRGGGRSRRHGLVGACARRRVLVDHVRFVANESECVGLLQGGLKGEIDRWD